MQIYDNSGRPCFVSYGWTATTSIIILKARLQAQYSIEGSAA
ncbi:hypothetical protein NCHU2750_55080 (plasmid) [Neorhizobium sp. NCHU2750]|nr:hypothetical protein NCHU2750_55080 [Neorhizobium sp. NCHU2750]